MKKFIYFTLPLLAGRWGENARITQVEQMADAVCACQDAACATQTGAFLDERGLEQEDYATLPDDLIARYQTAWDKAFACRAAWAD